MSYKSTLYSQYKSGLETAINSLHNAKLTERVISTNFLPIVEIKHLNYDLDSETMGKEKQFIRIGYEINIYAEDMVDGTSLIEGETIVADLEEIVIDYFNTEGFTFSTPSVANADVNVSRKLIRVSAVYDENRNVVYRG